MKRINNQDNSIYNTELQVSLTVKELLTLELALGETCDNDIKSGYRRRYSSLKDKPNFEDSSHTLKLFKDIHSILKEFGIKDNTDV